MQKKFAHKVIKMGTTKATVSDDNGYNNIFNLIFNTQGKSVEGIEIRNEMMYQTYNRTCEVF